MNDDRLTAIRALLEQCSIDEQKALFQDLRATHSVHEFEQVIGAPAEMILEAIHRAPELTRRMLRGVIADAAFAQFTVPTLSRSGWVDVTPVGNYAYDYKLKDDIGLVTVQIKLQRSERGTPVVRDGRRYGFDGKVFTVETQKSRTGTDADDNKTRPYRYGEFDVLAVSMQPSTGKWNRFLYTVGAWLIQGKKPNEIATMQPVAGSDNEYWTDDFDTVVRWLRQKGDVKRMTLVKTKPE
ncbi:hypothetical protein [Hydrocarboniphaga sp.]|uniref:hypothetical protein n=1 Tax=Hydrocarboniphaga sp. TaxID=2033016 RepID=UPI003D11D3F1